MKTRAPQYRHAFTLIEMLVVVSIVVLLLAFATPALTRTLQASRLSAAAEAIIGTVAEAQQASLSSNSPVELRFFSFRDNLDQTSLYHSYQIFKVTQVSQSASSATSSIAEGVTPLGNLINLPEGIVIPTDADTSKALSGNGLEDTKDSGQTGYSGVPGATYKAFRFMPDGTCRTVGAAVGGLASLTFPNLPENYFTVTFDVGGADITPDRLPKNFVTIQIDPYTGKARSYKPGF